MDVLLNYETPQNKEQIPVTEAICLYVSEGEHLDLYVKFVFWPYYRTYYSIEMFIEFEKESLLLRCFICIWFYFREAAIEKVWLQFLVY